MICLGLGWVDQLGNFCRSEDERVSQREGQVDLAIFPLPMLHVHAHKLSAFIDSGVDTAFTNLGKQLGLTTSLLFNLLQVWDLDNHLLHQVIHKTEPVHMIMSGNHYLGRIPHYSFPSVSTHPWQHLADITCMCTGSLAEF